MRLASCLLLLVLAAASQGQGKLRELIAAKPPEGCVERTWDVGGVKRTAIVRAPLTKGEARTPVVFGWHGHYGTAARVAGSWDITKLWPEAVFVFPQGLPTATINDPSGKGNGWQTKQGAQEDRDLKFFDAMLADVLKDYGADAGRVYSLGHSNGAAFSYLLWQARPEVLAAIGSVAGSLRGDGKPTTPLPVIHVAGKKDPLVKFAWQQATFAAVRRFNGCAEEGQPWAKEGVLDATIYASSKGAPLVTAIHEGGHEYAKGSTELIIRFFKENAKSAK